MSNFTTTWTDAMVQRLIAMRNAGYSASQIATDLGGGLTRNAVIGKVHRLGLPPHADAFPPQPAERVKRSSPKPRQVASTITGIAYVSVGNHRAYRTRQPKPLPVNTPLQVVCEPVAFLDRALDQCAAIVSEDPVLCCARPVGLNWQGQPSSYCREHHARYYQKPVKWTGKRARVSA